MTVGEERIWVNQIDAIIEKEAVGRGVKGIIHARSYDRARTIFARSRFKDLLVIHDSRHARDTVAQFKRSTSPCVLLSPSVSTGYDFPMDEARFQIIAKVPFIDNRPAVIRARHKADKGYLDYVALVELIQMAGRGVRSDRDFCNTYICDDNWIDWFYPRNKRMVPLWFREAVVRINSLDEVA
jgi:Rad3-related DNA helicase